MDFGYIIEFFNDIKVLMPQILEGLGVTLKLFCMTLIFSLPLGLILSLGRISRIKPLKWIIQFYLLVFRGTPLMLQLFFFYFGLPFLDIPNPFGAPINIVLDRYPAALWAFVLNYAAYFAEIFRGGIIGVNVGQYEASKALGLNSFQTMRHVVIPQMLRMVIPPVANETIVLVKDTALVSSIALIDMLKKAQQAVNRDMNVTAYFIVAVIYLAITLILTFAFEKTEKKLSLCDKKQ